MSFKDFYFNEVRPRLMKKMGIKNPFAVPKIKKVVINVGVGEGALNKNAINKTIEELSLIAGQKAVPTLAKKSVSAFKIRKGATIGVKVTLRGKRMYDFLERLIKIVLPRIKDFQGISFKSLDGHGNLNIGISEQILFPEVSYDKIEKIRGLQVTIVTNAKDNEMGKELFKELGIPFERKEKK